ncbi:MAG: RecX family transcriptional regulator [Anaerolineae bacterium]|nr:RecX family transcriptional regulator [Anaerolineae bacterium]
MKAVFLLNIDMGRIITALTAQKKNPNRINVFLDGEFAFGLERIVAAWLRINQDLSEEKITRLLNDDTREVAYQKALHFLSFRPRTEKEVRQNLISKEFDAELVEEVIERLKEKQFINDLQFARIWIENRNVYRPRGQKALAVELHQKGVSGDAIQEALAGMGDESELAESAARKYAQRLQGEDWIKFREKLSAFLGRRGFSYETIKGTVRRVWEEIQSSQEVHQM